MKPIPTKLHHQAHLPKQRDAITHASLARRFLLLLACIALGLVIGFVGQAVTSKSVWFLAVPVCVAIGWLFVADPAKCVAPPPPTRQDDSDS